MIDVLCNLADENFYSLKLINKHHMQHKMTLQSVSGLILSSYLFLLWFFCLRFQSYRLLQWFVWLPVAYVTFYG